MFEDLGRVELDIIITGLRRVRSGHCDNYVRGRAGAMLDEAQIRRRAMNRIKMGVEV